MPNNTPLLWDSENHLLPAMGLTDYLGFFATERIEYLRSHLVRTILWPSLLVLTILLVRQNRRAIMITTLRFFLGLLILTGCKVMFESKTDHKNFSIGFLIAQQFAVTIIPMLWAAITDVFPELMKGVLRPPFGRIIEVTWYAIGVWPTGFYLSRFVSKITPRAAEAGRWVCIFDNRKQQHNQCYARANLRAGRHILV